MNPADHWRTTLTQPLIPLYAANPHVAAVLLGGSTARDHADRYSDIELGVFWHQPPTDEERQQAADQITANYGDPLRLCPYDPDEEVWADDFTLGRAQHYPDQLAYAVVRRHAQIDHFWRWGM